VQDFLSAVRAKRLDRVAAAYAVAGWLSVQAASIVLPTFGTPAWALRTIIAIAFIGFPVALFVAWFSIPHPHPDDIPKLKGLTPGEFMLIGLLGGVLLLSIAQLSYQFLTRSPAASNSAQSSLSASRDSLRVAIIPFDIIGTGSDTSRAFADSLLDKIVETLAANQVDTVSRSDSLTLRNGNPGAAAALTALRVGMTLEGSVENDGKTITVRLHLDDVQQHQTLWSKEFRGPADSPEPLQTQVALHATDVTRWAVSPRLKVIRSDPSLVATYLEGLDENSIAGGAHAIAVARNLVSRAPGFAAAHTLLASTVGQEGGLQAVTPEERAETIREARIAISLDGGDGQAYALLSEYLSDISIKEREQLLLKGLSIEPGSPSANFDYSVLILANTGRSADAIAQAQNAWQLAPFTEWVAWAVPLLMGNVGRIDEARNAIVEMKRRWPDNPDVIFKAVEFGVESRNPPFARALSLLGDSDLRNYLDHPPYGKPGATDVLRAALLARVGSPKVKQSAVQLIERAVENGTIDASAGIANLVSLGAVEDAFRAADRVLNKSHERVGIQFGIWGNAYELFGLQTTEMRRDPRFMQLAQRLGLVDYWQTTGHWPDFCSEPGLPYDCKAIAVKLKATSVRR
jgi:TolB-like protein